MSIIEAVILAGGEDKRLNPLTSRADPKCLLTVANTPVLFYALKSLKVAGVHSAFVVRTQRTRSKQNASHYSVLCMMTVHQ